MATSASPRTVPARHPSRNAPALYRALVSHLAALRDRLRAIRLTGHMTPSWHFVGREIVADVKLFLDPQSDTLLEDERRARAEAREILISRGFYVGGNTGDLRVLRVTGYFGRVVCASDAPALRDDGPGLARAPRRFVRIVRVAA
jgi:hypothetical protein